MAKVNFLKRSSLLTDVVRTILAVCLLGLLLSACRQAPSSQATAVSTPTSAVTPTATPVMSETAAGISPSVTIFNDVIYATTQDQQAYALRVSDGTRIWRAHIDGNSDDTPVVSNGIVYITSFVGQDGPGYLTALRASDGMQLWRYRSQSYIWPPTERNGLLYLVEQSGFISALQARNGVSVWHIQKPANQNIVMGKDAIYINALEAVYALNLRTGATIWKHETPASEDRLTLNNGMIYICCEEGQIEALTASNGQPRWKQALDATMELEAQFSAGTMYLRAGKMILDATPTAREGSFLPVRASLNSLPQQMGRQARLAIPHKLVKSTVYALRLSDGKRLWAQEMKQTYEGVMNWLQITPGLVYTASGNELFALDSSDGHITWQHTAKEATSGAVMDGGIVYSINDHTISAFNSNNGDVLWTYDVAGNSYNAPLLVRDTIYISTNLGQIYALHIANGGPKWHYVL